MVERLDGLGPVEGECSDGKMLGLLLILYPALFTFLATALRHLHGFPLDDSYIYQTVARNLAWNDTLGFIAGQRSSGATSLLWAFVQAFNYKTLGPIDPVRYNLVLSYVLLSSIGVLLYLIARRDSLDQRTCLIIAAAPAFCGNFLWLGMIGMEHVMFLSLSLLAIFLWFAPEPTSKWNVILASFTSGLLVITRPEGIAFGPLLLLAGMRSEKGRRRSSEIAVFSGIWFVFLILSLATNWWTSGALMPQTLRGRSWLYFHSSGGPHTVRSLERFCGGWVQRLPRQFSTSSIHQLTSLHDLLTVQATIGVMILSLILIGVWSVLRGRPLRLGFLILWAAVDFLIYAVAFPAAGHGGRYQSLTLLLLLPLALLGIRVLLTATLAQHPRMVFRMTLGVMLIAGSASISTWRKVTLVGIAHINDTHGKIGQWMVTHVPTDARFAAFDIGRVSYDWGGQVIDLGGLVDPEYYKYLENRQVPLYLAERHVQYLSLPGSGTKELGFDDRMKNELVEEYCSSQEGWLLGFRFTIHATRCQDLYRLSNR